MKSLHQYLNGLSPAQQQEYATRCGTTVGYLRKAISKGQRLGEGLCINLEKWSGSAVRLEDVRPDVDWAYVQTRGTASEANDAQAQPAQQQEARHA